MVLLQSGKKNQIHLIFCMLSLDLYGIPINNTKLMGEEFSYFILAQTGKSLE